MHSNSPNHNQIQLFKITYNCFLFSFFSSDLMILNTPENAADCFKQDRHINVGAGVSGDNG